MKLKLCIVFLFLSFTLIQNGVYFGVIKDGTYRNSKVELHLKDSLASFCEMDEQFNFYRECSGRLKQISSSEYRFEANSDFSIGICRQDMVVSGSFEILFDSLAFLNMKGQPLEISSKLNAVHKTLIIGSDNSKSIRIFINTTQIANQIDLITLKFGLPRESVRKFAQIQFPFNNKNWKSDVQVRFALNSNENFFDTVKIEKDKILLKSDYWNDFLELRNK